MLRTFLGQVREALDDAGSSVASVAEEVAATVEALVDAVDQRVEEATPAVEEMIERVGVAGSRALGSALLLAALGGLLFAGWQQLNRVHRRRVTGRSLVLPEPLHRWEGEGGQNQMVAEAAPLAGQTAADNSLTPAASSTRPAPTGAS